MYTSIGTVQRFFSDRSICPRSYHSRRMLPNMATTRKTQESLQMAYYLAFASSVAPSHTLHLSSHSSHITDSYQHHLLSHNDTHHTTGGSNRVRYGLLKNSKWAGKQQNSCSKLDLVRLIQSYDSTFIPFAFLLFGRFQTRIYYIGLQWKWHDFAFVFSTYWYHWKCSSVHRLNIDSREARYPALQRDSTHYYTSRLFLERLFLCVY